MTSRTFVSLSATSPIRKSSSTPGTFGTSGPGGRRFSPRSNSSPTISRSPSPSFTACWDSPTISQSVLPRMPRRTQRRRSRSICGHYTPARHTRSPTSSQSLGHTDVGRYDHFIHTVSKELVVEARRHDCDLIAFENLTGIRERMPRAKKFHTWAFRRLFEYGGPSPTDLDSAVCTECEANVWTTRRGPFIAECKPTAKTVSLQRGLPLWLNPRQEIHALRSRSVSRCSSARPRVRLRRPQLGYDGDTANRCSWRRCSRRDSRSHSSGTRNSRRDGCRGG
ncbi:MAG: hypothetical protein J07HQX50_01144 [Haloquadratum sp. J07HQX50]|nr:MAG: hypothetical protein J07HQX50_01144 [Haloquadratum sp. J07HQX50]